MTRPALTQRASAAPAAPSASSVRPVYGGVPSMYALLNRYRHAGRYDVSVCRLWICGGAPLPRPVSDAFIGGHLARKCGLTHFHVGPGRRRLALLRRLLDEFEVKPEWLYPTHVERTESIVADQSKDGQKLMLDYLAATDSTGELPLDNPDMYARALESGRVPGRRSTTGR